ncbi:hypothetical protein HO173_010975 [Letharia columbiana]|uniref:Uncharacterized protein n=1 Tax=Letharia columbiana TaxID=112416 RepID=A0A8H6FLQ9_9LECA|nr:uncharacterized protein HO173_010975 [Letharia columbiana]KAF6230859.1 hypothetical protein HO173_010975 [Letharia columbiana]
MGGRPKKPKSTGRVYKTVPNIKQSRIGPSPHRTIRDRLPTWSAPNMRQQSITQMDALRDYYHPELENEDLKTDDEEVDSYVASPSRNKRRKVTPEKSQARRIETRSAKRQAAKEDLPIQELENQDDLPSAGGEAKAHLFKDKMPTAMPPPKTPMSLRRKEIPSSQSPADTPLSTQSRQSLQDYTRSPLKEKSTNIDLSIRSPVKGARWSKGLEVADSMETEDEDSPVSLKVSIMTERVGPTAEPEDITEEEPRLPSYASAIHVDDFNQRLRAAQRPVQEIQNSSQARPKHEVIDSTDEEGDDEEPEAFNAGPETQAALASTDISQKSSDQPPESTPPTSKPAEDEPELAPIQRNASESPDPLNAPSPLARERNVEDQLPMQRPKRVEFVDLTSSDPPGPTTHIHPSERPSDSEGVSAQLFADLRRDTQPGGLQTESQYEKGWTIYNPADYMHSNLEPLPSSSPKPAEQPSSGLMTVPTQLIRPPISSPPKFYKAPIPSSQATTADVTQPSPRNMTSSAQAVTQRSPRKLPSSSQAHPSSPPPMPPPSSSPLASRKLDPWAGYEWNGVRLTDSQLLPDSLLNDSEVGPPELSQDSWFEEA